MLSLKRPDIESVQIYEACLAGIVDPALKRKLELCTPKVLEAENRLERALQDRGLHTLDPLHFGMLPNTATEVAEHIYNRGLVKRRAGRVYYDRIMSVSDYDLCPRCGFGEVKSIDHHLPKSFFPALAVAVSNLLPVCTDCNKMKSDRVPALAAEQIMHPYFDSVDADRWLGANLLNCRPAVVEFSVIPPSTWSTELGDRMKNHFEVFDLAHRYSLQANRLIASFQTAVLGWNTSGGPELASANLSDLGYSYLQRNPNSHQGVALMALAESEWFCSGQSFR